MSPSSDRSTDRTATFVFVVVFALLASAGLAMHALGLNGPRHWFWRWRDLSPSLVAVVLVLPLLAIVESHRRWILGSDPPRAGRALLVLVLSSVALQAGALYAEPLGLKRLHDLVLSHTATSYYTDAFRIQDVSNFLAEFHTAKLTLHSMTHPPGPILFYYALIELFGSERAPYAAGATVMLLSALVLPVFYFAAATWLRAPRARLAACSLYALAPTLVVFLPALDTMFAVIALILAAAWQRALDEEVSSGPWSVAAGAALFVASLLAYNILAIGGLILLLAACHVFYASDRLDALKDVAIAAAASLATFIVLHLLLHFATGYRPIASFQHALELQEGQLGRIRRPYYPSVFIDLYGFFVLGAGAVAAPLVLRGLADSLGRREGEIPSPPYALLGVAAVLIVDFSGLLPGESSRVWSFLYPFAFLSVGLALVELSTRRQLVLIALQWVYLVAAKANILFVSPY